MNKTEKIICILIGAAMIWYWFIGSKPSKEQVEAAETQARAQAIAAQQARAANAAKVPRSESSQGAQGATAPGAASASAQTAPAPVFANPSVPEETLFLENEQLKIVLSSWGAVVKGATLKEYAKEPGALSEENPAVEISFADAPLAAVEGVPALAANAAYAVKSAGSNEVVFANETLERKITLGENYLITVEDRFLGGADAAAENSLSLGSMAMGLSKNDLLSIDSWVFDPNGGKVVHHGDDGDSPLKSYLVGSNIGGCSGASSAAGLPVSTVISYPGEQTWIALKNRFFVTALVRSDARNHGFVTTVTRDVMSATYRPDSVASKICFTGVPASRTSVFYVGPKQQSILWGLGMKDVMEFGMWRWICYGLLAVLNFFYALIPNYGVAIILLTIAVRLVFWPLTHKSTEGMKKMQEIQPKVKELQQKFKDNPQRMQQEVWSLYRENKVNPMSSCLPMLIQIPVFFALFVVLRSAVELRYADFLWIADLSEPEGLFAAWFPFGGLNILPIIMAATMALQSALTPSAGGDNQQRKMMIVMMPIMMLVMCYRFASALCLYWTLSNVVGIVQAWMIKRQAERKQPAISPDQVIDPPETRQMRRHRG